MSLLYRRALSALKGLHAGDGQPHGGGGMLDWSLTLASWLIARRRGPHPAHQISESGDLSHFPTPPKELDSEYWTAGAGVVVGLLRRPQDHNGIVDDAVTLVVPILDTSVDVASACALAAYLSSLMDGWDMESAMSQALFVAKRGETFGKEKGPSVVQALNEILDRIYAAESQAAAASAVLAASREAEAAGRSVPVARALGLAYVYQDSTEVSSLLGQQGAASRFDSAIVTMLAAAFSPQSLPAGLGADIEDQTDVSELLDDLLELRSARYRRVPQYAARFRRKKC